MAKKKKEELKGKSRFPVFGVDIKGGNDSVTDARKIKKKAGPKKKEKKKKTETRFFGD